MDSPYGKTLFVITAVGERGPHTREEIAELLREKEILLDDKVRTAFGRQLGNVSDLFPRQSAKPSRPAPAPRRTGIPIMAIVASVVVLISAVGLLWGISSSGREQAPEPALAKSTQSTPAPPLPAFPASTKPRQEPLPAVPTATHANPPNERSDTSPAKATTPTVPDFATKPPAGGAMLFHGGVSAFATSWSDGLTKSVLRDPITNMEILRLSVETSPKEVWSGQTTVTPLAANIQTGNEIQIRFRARSIRGSTGKVSTVIGLNSPPWTVHFTDQFEISETWNAYTSTHIAKEDLPSAKGAFAISVRFKVQTIEIGDLSVVNLGTPR